jgi:hypothetical protein
MSLSEGYQPRLRTRAIAILAGPLLVFGVVAIWMLAFAGTVSWLAVLLAFALGDGSNGWWILLAFLFPGPISYALLRGARMLAVRMSVPVQGYWAAVILGLACGLTALLFMIGERLMTDRVFLDKLLA